MLFIFVLLTLLVVGGVYLERTNDYDSAGFVITIISGCTLFTALIFWPMSYYSHQSKIEQYNVTKRDIEHSRDKSMTDIERVALTNKIIELNRELASAKYWNGTIFDIYIPDEVMDLDYLK